MCASHKGSYTHTQHRVLSTTRDLKFHAHTHFNSTVHTATLCTFCLDYVCWADNICSTHTTNQFEAYNLWHLNTQGVHSLKPECSFRGMQGEDGWLWSCGEIYQRCEVLGLIRSDYCLEAIQVQRVWWHFARGCQVGDLGASSCTLSDSGFAVGNSTPHPQKVYTAYNVAAVIQQPRSAFI